MNNILQAIKSLFRKVERTIKDVNASISQLESNTEEALSKKAEKENPVFVGSFTLNGNGATGKDSFSCGVLSVASGDYSHAEGRGMASGDYSHAEGAFTSASDDYAHAEGNSTTAGSGAHAEGGWTYARGVYSHAEGYSTNANGNHSHAEGRSTTAGGERSHAEGFNTSAPGESSHAEGEENQAHGRGSHVEGIGNITTTDYCHVQGKYARGISNCAHIVGNGTYAEPSNAHTLDWEGNSWFAGDIKIGGNGYDSEDAKTLATKEYVAELLGVIENGTY